MNNRSKGQLKRWKKIPKEKRAEITAPGRKMALERAIRVRKILEAKL